MLRNSVSSTLAILARSVVRKYKPRIIMVTGSVGKTSTKDAIAAALSRKFNLRKSEKSQNSEFGMPFTILGVKNPWRSVLGWMHVFGEAIALIVLPNPYPELLVLEVGADQPGDLAKMLRIATPDAVVVTLLPEVPVHVEAYASPAEVREEEFTPATALPQGAPLILNATDKYALDLATRTAARVYTFGATDDADVRIEHSAIWMDSGKPKGMRADLVVEGKSYPVQVARAFGESQLYAPAAALATALAFGVSAEDAVTGLESYIAPPGRGRLFAGIKNSIIIDDSYNASPVAVAAALNSLNMFAAPLARRVAILGDMLELGRFSLESHARIGRIAAENVQLLVTVGTRSKAIDEAAIAAGLSPQDVHHFANSYDAAAAIQDLLMEGDIVLLKGSQTGVRLERVTKVLLADPKDAAALARQDAEWQKR